MFFSSSICYPFIFIRTDKQDTVAERLRRTISNLKIYNGIPNFRSVGSNPTGVTF